ncbi:MAG: amidohydrolase family protein [Candidatus Sumerlaeota bacterium]|nr:amidohydrolase family protein [Candidatus Sumerlaeota bacterium]
MAYRLFRARWVIPEPDVAIRDGAVLCRGDCIEACGAARDIEAPRNTQVMDLGNAVLLPGLINAHTHLELSALVGKLSGADGFVPWLRAMLDQWNQWSDEQYVDSVQRGFRECLACGVACVGNIASRPQADPMWIADCGLRIADCGTRIADCGLRIADYVPRATIFHEVIGLNPNEAEMRLESALARRLLPEICPRNPESRTPNPEPQITRHESRTTSHDSRPLTPDPRSLTPDPRPLTPDPQPLTSDPCLLRFALSPHAPYSVSSRLLRMCFDRAARLPEPICIHAAETREEEAFTLKGSGPIADFLLEKGVLPHDWRPPRRRPLEYLAEHGLGASPALVAHANYASDDEIRWMAARGISVAFCPPSHRFFNHEPYPLRAMIERGVNLCVATDSLASAASLDPLAALRQARAYYQSNASQPDLPAERWLAMITVNPARALGWQNELGMLRPGMAADMTAYEIPSNCAKPLEFLLSEEPRLVGVWIGAEKAFPACA